MVNGSLSPQREEWVPEDQLEPPGDTSLKTLPDVHVVTASHLAGENRTDVQVCVSSRSCMACRSPVLSHYPHIIASRERTEQYSDQLLVSRGLSGRPPEPAACPLPFNSEPPWSP